jgi:hypothetical protein
MFNAHDRVRPDFMGRTEVIDDRTYRNPDGGNTNARDLIVSASGFGFRTVIV